jgi:signal peptidase I
MRPTINPETFSVDFVEQTNSERSPTNDWFHFKRHFTPSRGDVVYLTNPRNGSSIVKRLVALPGDIVQPRGLVGQKQEPDPVTLTENQVWVESDAGKGYADSDLFGPVNLKLLKGKVGWVINPNASSLNFIGYRKIVSELSPEALARVTPSTKQ